jgi:hypothetical protein
MNIAMPGALAPKSVFAETRSRAPKCPPSFAVIVHVIACKEDVGLDAVSSRSKRASAKTVSVAVLETDAEVVAPAPPDAAYVIAALKEVVIV